MRWSALVLGVFYGFYHQSTLTSQAKAAQVEREYQHKESLIQQAKAEWVKKSLPPEKKTPGGGST
jgi:F-type H+-transporting ATP synthase subunit e